MGANMARRLNDLGAVFGSVYDAQPGLARSLATELGTSFSERLSDVTASAEVIFTVVSDDEAMESIFAE